MGPMSAQVAQALIRFGLGARPDQDVPSDPLTWLQAQLSGPDTAPQSGLPSLTQCLAQLKALWDSTPGSAQYQAALAAVQQIAQAELLAFYTNAVTTTAPFRERLVWFWANHFNVSMTDAATSGTVGNFIRTAIRPNVTGTFADMLLAVMTHPAMLYYLNNDVSKGPQSAYAKQVYRKTGIQLGINENLGRECLELHTVGVNAGYTQADVDAMAYILTGWTVGLGSGPIGYVFNSSWHQPGSQTVMGQIFPPTQHGGVAALQYLATHVATYQHLATQLVQHFISDSPDADDVAEVMSALYVSGGSLPAAMQALLSLPNAWLPLVKFRPPQDWLVAVLRAAQAANLPQLNMPSLLYHMGQPAWDAPFPNGWSDLMSGWASSVTEILRARWSVQFGAALQGIDPLSLAALTLGPYLSAATQQAIGAAPTAAEGLAILFMAPEFQRR